MSQSGAPAHDKNAAEGVIVALSRVFGSILAPDIISTIAYVAVDGSRAIIEDEQRQVDAKIALAGSTTALSPNGITVVMGNWRKSEYGQVVSDEILKASPKFVHPLPKPKFVLEALTDEEIALLQERRVLPHVPEDAVISEPGHDDDGNAMPGHAHIPMPPSAFARNMQDSILIRQNSIRVVN